MSPDVVSPDDDAFADDVRAAMRAHDVQAPAEVHWTPPSPNSDGSRTWLPIAAAAAVVAVVIGAVLALSGSGPDAAPGITSDGSLSCPKSVQQPDKQFGTVPAKPIGVDGSKRLVPDKTPTTVVVCSYPGKFFIPSGQTRTIKLSGRKELSGPLRHVTESLTLRPAASKPLACELVGEFTDGDDYLIGITYGTDTLWVAVPGNHCDGATNGRFTTSSNLRGFAAAAYTAGHWVSSPSAGAHTPGDTAGPCRPTDFGRLGQQKSLVPAGYATLTVCTYDGTKHRTLAGAAAAPLVQALNALPTRPSDSSCTPRAAGPGPLYEVIARYPSGPAVSVMVSLGCTPHVDNSALQSTRLGSVPALIEAALR